MKHLINFTCYKKQITYFRTVIYSPFLYPKTEKNDNMKLARPQNLIDKPPKMEYN